MVAVRGFILQPTYRIESGRPVVHLHGRLETGEAFLIRETRSIPHFFVRALDVPAVRGAARVVVPTGLRSMQGDEVARVELSLPADAPSVREALRAQGLPTFEADVRFAMRTLIDRALRGSIAIEGESAGGATRAFENPLLSPSDWEPRPQDLVILSIDLETDPRGRHVFSAALAGRGVDEVLLALPEAAVEAARRTLGGESGALHACGDEAGLLRRLFERLRGLDFDILTGWNVIDFDLSVLIAAATRLGIPIEIGRAPGAARVVRERSTWRRGRAEIPGRLVLDGIDLLKSAFVKLDDYRLDTAGLALLGEGKVALDHGIGAPGEGGPPSPGGRAEAIERTFREDLPRFVRYNRNDARLVLRILDKARLVELTVRRSLLTGMPLDRVGASIASFDALYLNALRLRGRVAPSVGRDHGEIRPTLGGAVLEPAPGLYENVLAFDFKSLYPSLIRTFNIDPLGHVPHPAPDEEATLLRAPNGAFFRREPGILPGILTALFPKREEAKRRGDAVGSQAVKILMNSFYGVLATPACRFYSSEVANAITHFGQWVLHWARDRVEASGQRVLYGDTDSLFVLSGCSGPEASAQARRLGAALAERINADLSDLIRERYAVTSHLELEFEALYLKLLLPAMRHGQGGARKRYAGLMEPARGPGAALTVFVGMEVVRRDWTELSKEFQRGLYERLFQGDSREVMGDYVRRFAADLRAGRHDAKLVYRKALRKGLNEYTATTPPHVKAARQLPRGATGLIEYVMTTSGPEPAAQRRSPFDYEHYVDKQIRPIAEAILPHVGLDLDALVEGDRQRRLF
ncbi:MAG TPA: DNA polymerase II [Candidatus Polarisedimenticolia bacterium]